MYGEKGITDDLTNKYDRLDENEVMCNICGNCVLVDVMLM